MSLQGRKQKEGGAIGVEAPSRSKNQEASEISYNAGPSKAQPGGKLYEGLLKGKRKAKTPPIAKGVRAHIRTAGVSKSRFGKSRQDLVRRRLADVRKRKETHIPVQGKKNRARGYKKGARNIETSLISQGLRAGRRGASASLT